MAPFLSGFWRRRRVQRYLLALLKDYQITDVNIDPREVSPQLLKPVGDLDPIVDVVSSLTRPLHLYQGQARRSADNGPLYLAEGGGKDRLLDLSCRHVLIRSKEDNLDYVHHPNGPRRDALLLGRRAFTNLVDSIKLEIGGHGVTIKRWRKQIEGFEEREKGTNAVDVGVAGQE